MDAVTDRVGERISQILRAIVDVIETAIAVERLKHRYWHYQVVSR